MKLCNAAAAPAAANSTSPETDAEESLRATRNLFSLYQKTHPAAAGSKGELFTKHFVLSSATPYLKID